MKLKSYYQKDRYNRANLDWRASEFFPKKLAKVLEVTQLKLKGKVLDVGCGDGGLAKEIKNKYPNAKVYGVDISRKGVEFARKYCVDAKVADLNKKFPFKDEMFDYVISFEVIEHLIETDNFLRETKRILKKNGKGIITTPNLPSWYQRVLCIFGIIPTFMELSTEDRTIGLGLVKKFTKNKQPVGHIRVFNKSGIEDILEKTGLKIVRTKSSPIDFPLPQPFGLLFKITDKFMSRFPSLGADIVVVFKK